MLLRRVAIALLASGVVVTTMGITSAATGDVAQSPRQLTPGGELHGSGASFPCGYIEQAIEDAENDDLVVTYDCNGSGTGRAEFIEGTVEFAGTDVPLSDAEEAQLAAKGMGYLQFAYVGGGIVIAYNPGSGLPYNLRLSADTIGKIFSGRIVNWDDPELADENPGVSLPDLSLRVAARSDSSGTTNGFTSFLAETSTSWSAGARDVFDSPPLPAFPGLVTAEGSDGVADAVRDNPGMIGYVELSFARERRLNVAAVEGADGFVLPDTSAVTEAIASLRLNGDGTVTPSFATTPGYPLSVVTYLLLRQDYEDRQTAVNVRAFAQLLLSNSGKAASLAYAPLSTSLLTHAGGQIATVGPGGTGVATTTTVAPVTVAPVTVQPEVVTQATTAPTTPVTGSPSAALIGLGLALIAFGLGLIRLSRGAGELILSAEH